MAEIVATGALSHSPLLNFPEPNEARAYVESFRKAARDFGADIRALRPDVVVVFAQDHFRTLFYDNMSAFLIGLGPVSRWGDWHGKAGPLKSDPALARHIARTLFENGFEPSVSYDMQVDHGVAQPLELLDLEGVAVVPILVNAAAPPLPSPRRCYEFGSIVGAAIQSFPGARRVAIIGSGGLSHSPVKVTIESDDPAHSEANQFMIHGRSLVAEREEGRIKALMGRLDDLAKSINPEWDRAFLKRLSEGGIPELAAALNAADIERNAGAGAQEVRAWLASLGAAHVKSATTLYYAPSPFLVTGMGIVRGDLEPA